MSKISNFKFQISKLLAPRVDYQPLIEVQIFKDALLHNLKAYQQKYPKLQFAPVLKSNAYGHGLVQVAMILDNQEPPFFMVDSFFEAYTLRRAGVKSKILMLGYNRLELLVNPKLKNCSATIIDFSTLKNVIAKLSRSANFHLKIDTGMSRQGISIDDVPKAIALLKSNPNFILEGVCSHLASADDQDQAFTQAQIRIWNEAVSTFKQNFTDIKYFHLAATAGAVYSSGIDANIARLGLGLYGINLSPFEKLELKPALEMKSLLSSVKQLPMGRKIGYGGTFEAKQSMIVATVPAGYNEGVDRRLSNKGSFTVRGQACPIVGRVSMNMTSIDVSAIADAKVGDEVVIISANPKDINSVESFAKLCGTVAHEILVHIPQHLRRMVI